MTETKRMHDAFRTIFVENNLNQCLVTQIFYKKIEKIIEI